MKEGDVERRKEDRRAYIWEQNARAIIICGYYLYFRH